jgi:hypothetical protein
VRNIGPVPVEEHMTLIAPPRSGKSGLAADGVCQFELVPCLEAEASNPGRDPSDCVRRRQKGRVSWRVRLRQIAPASDCSGWMPIVRDCGSVRAIRRVLQARPWWHTSV